MAHRVGKWEEVVTDWDEVTEDVEVCAVHACESVIRGKKREIESERERHTHVHKKEKDTRAHL